MQGAGLDLAAGREFGTWGEARLGYRFTSGDVDVRVGDPGLQTGDFELAQIYARLSLDKFDNAYFPRSGNKGKGRVFVGAREISARQRLRPAEPAFLQAFSAGDATRSSRPRATTPRSTARRRSRASSAPAASCSSPATNRGAERPALRRARAHVPAARRHPDCADLRRLLAGVRQRLAKQGRHLARQRPIRRQRVHRRVGRYTSAWASPSTAGARRFSTSDRSSENDAVYNLRAGNARFAA